MFKIFAYHGVVRKLDEFDKFFDKHVLFSDFKKQISSLKNDYKFITLDQFEKKWIEKKLKDNEAMIFFDDCYKTVLNGAKYLAEQKIPATFAVSSDLVDKGYSWTDDIEKIILNTKNRKLKFGGIFYDLSQKKNKFDATVKLKRYFRDIPARKIQGDIKKLSTACGVDPRNIKRDKYEMISWDDLKKLQSNKKFDFVHHGHYHYPFSRYETEKEIESDIRANVSILQDKLSINPRFFVYPFGQEKDFDDRVKKIIVSHGFKYAFASTNKIFDYTYKLSISRNTIGNNNIQKIRENIKAENLMRFNQITIEPTNVCNLICPGCPNGRKAIGKSGTDRAAAFMTFQQFKKIVDNNIKCLRHINLFGIGEPFLAPDIMKMIEYAGEKDILISIHTNGNAFNKKFLNQFASCRTKISFTFSIDGTCQKTYGSYRMGGSYKKAMDNLKHLIRLKRKYRLSNIKIIWQFLIMRPNEQQLPEALEIAKHIGVDVMKFKTINNNPLNPDFDYLEPRNYKKFFKNNGKDIWTDGDDYKIVRNNECDFIRPGSVFIHCNGDVVPCCYDYRGGYIMGNAYDSSLINLWETKKYIFFRLSHYRGDNELCNFCRFKKKVEFFEKKLSK